MDLDPPGVGPSREQDHSVELIPCSRDPTGGHQRIEPVERTLDTVDEPRHVSRHSPPGASETLENPDVDPTHAVLTSKAADERGIVHLESLHRPRVPRLDPVGRSNITSDRALAQGEKDRGEVSL
jgi:hypothetical protein